MSIQNELRCVFENKPLRCESRVGNEVLPLMPEFFMCMPSTLPIKNKVEIKTCEEATVSDDDKATFSEDEEDYFGEEEEIPMMRVVHKENGEELLFRLNTLDMDREGCDIFLKMRFYIAPSCFITSPQNNVSQAFLDLNGQRIWVESGGFGFWICV